MICQAYDRIGRLNAFQRVMLQWSELSPYNAVHAYKLAGPADALALRDAIGETYDLCGIGIAEIDAAADRMWYRHTRDAAPAVEIAAGAGTAEERLNLRIADEVNRPFGRPVCKPFRIGIVDGGPASHYVTLTYDHWASDSISARLLMRHVLGRYLGLDIPENRESLDLYPGTYREVFPRQLRGSRLAMPLLRSLHGWLRHRSARQTAYASSFQMSVGYEHYVTQPGTVEAIRQFARQNGASVHDVFLAALGGAMADFLPRRASKGKGGDIALGTIVDTRADANEDLDETLGTFLGYYVMRLAGDKSIGLAELTRRIAEKTFKIKRRQSYLDAAVNFRVSSKIWPRLRPESRPVFARRAMPLTAGITNVYLHNDWMTQYADGKILEYRRAVSNGPTLPIVLSPTTFRNQLNIGVNYRETGFSRRRVDDIMSAFVGHLESLAGGAKTAGRTPRRHEGHGEKNGRLRAKIDGVLAK